MKLFYPFVIIFLLMQTTVNSQTKSPSDYLGYQLGERFTFHNKVIEYFSYVESKNANVKLEKYGETYEHRPLYTTVITSPENFSKLEEIRENQLRSAGMEKGNFQDNGISIVWLSYNVHGNEAVSTEVAMKTLYELVNPENKQTQKWLKNTVVIIDPCLNPDGRERYINWYYQKVGSTYNPDPNATEHHEIWPGGRPNHYLFDLNRDWVWATQIETQQRIKVYNRWMPNIHVDFHEQGVDSPYYFAPAAEPYHEVITQFQRDFQRVIGKNNAKYFDKNGWLYFSKERFDLLYPSYGDTYPTFNGAIGMTYEQGGSGRAGLGIINREGDELKLIDRIDHHFATSMSTIEMASVHAGELTEQFHKYFTESKNNPKEPYKTYVIRNTNTDRIKSITDLLDRHHILYGSPKTTKTLKGFRYSTKKFEKFALSDKDLIISAYQPKSNLVKALFEPVTQLNDTLTYDITAWALPYARGLDAFALTTRLDTKVFQNTLRETPNYESEKPYAYLNKWNSVNDVEYLSALLKKKIKVRFSQKAFSINGKNYEPGTLIITRAGNQKVKDFDQIVRKLAEKYERPLKSVQTGMVDSGKDFGSGEVSYLKKPKIALLSGEGTSSLSFGALWHFFEQQIKYPVTVIDTRYFNNIDLNKYNVLILPNGYYGEVLNKKTLPQLLSWIQKGGKVIAINGAISAFAGSIDFDISVYEDEKSKKAAEKVKDSVKKQMRLKSYNELERSYLSNLITGSVFKIHLDNTNPLGFGNGDFYYTLKQGNRRYAYLKEGYNVGIIKDGSELISGFAGKNILKSIEKSLVYGVESKGKGELIYLVDDPLFRSFWENGKLLFSNAVFMVGQ